MSAKFRNDLRLLADFAWVILKIGDDFVLIQISGMQLMRPEFVAAVRMAKRSNG